VTATIGGDTITAPKAPEPEARFRVASESDSALLQSLAQQSELAFALTAWKLGLVEDARDAVRKLSARNTGSGEVARIAAAMGARP